VKKDILATPKGKVITGTDGKKYTLAPLCLNTFANIEEEFDCEMVEFQEKLKKRSYSQIRRLIWVLLHEGYPDLSLSDVGKLIPLNVDLLTAIMNEIAVAFDELNQ